MKINNSNLTIEEHLFELKKRLLSVVVTLIVGFLICLWKSNDILSVFLKQGRDAGYVMIAISPQEALLQQVRVSLTCGLLITLPVLIYEAVAFVTPAFDKKNILKFWISVVAGVALFIIGMSFAICVLFPFVLNYMNGIAVSSDINMQISVENYVSFILTSVILIGLIFEMPIVSIFLTGMNILTSSNMKKYRKVVIVLIFVIAAIITPPDVVTQIMVAIPMIILYELSIGLCKAVEKKQVSKSVEVQT